MLRVQLIAPRPFGRTGHVEDPTLGVAQRLAPNFAPQVQLERAQVRCEPLRSAVPVEAHPKLQASSPAVSTATSVAELAVVRRAASSSSAISP